MAIRKKADPFDASSPLLPGDSYHEQLVRAMAAKAQPPPLPGVMFNQSPRAETPKPRSIERKES